MRYETPNYARLFRGKYNDAHDDAVMYRNEKKHLRDTLTEVMKTFKGDLATQKMILEVVHKQGHDGHLIRRLQNNMDTIKLEKEIVSADWLLENMWQFPNETWWEATFNGEHRQFVRIRLDIEKQEYVLDVIGQDRKHSEELWRYKGGDWQFKAHHQ